MRPAVLAPVLASATLVTLLLSASVPAQTPPAPATDKPAVTPSTLSVDARLVNLPVVVRDKKGALVQSLTKDDFTLQVDGHPQVIRYFDKDTNLPLTLGLLVDTSASQRKVIDDERTASSSFLDQMLTTDKDKAFLIQFSRQVELLQDVTGSKPKLQAALKEIDTPVDPNASGVTPVGGNDPNSGNSGHRNDRAGTTLYDSLFLAADEILSKQKGRKALILLTDGDDRGSRESIASAIEAAQRADTIVYAIYFKGESDHSDFPHPGSGGRNGGGMGYPGGGGMGYPGGGYPGGGGGGRNGGGQRPSTESRPDGKKILTRITNETGGRLFEVSKKETTAQIYTEIAEELRAQYRLGYTPDQATSADGYHKIDLAFARPEDKKLQIQTREGYYTGK